jgi:arylsulfatase A
MIATTRTRRLGPRACACAALGALCMLLAPNVGDASSPAAGPNFVFVLMDDMGCTDLGCCGSDFYQTPQLDRLAADGMRFTCAYAAAPVCSPTRASIMTGKYPARLHLTNFIAGRRRFENGRILPAPFELQLSLHQTTLAESLKSAGYTTGYFGKWHLGGATHSPGRQGFDQWQVADGRHFATPLSNAPVPALPEGVYLADYLTDRAVEFIERHRDHPFYLQVSHFAVHIPLQAKAELIAKYDAKAKLHPGTRHGNAIYAAMIESVDQGIGRIRATLARLGIDRRTVVVFTSDNGGLSVREGPNTPATTNAPARDGKGYLYEGGLRVPWIVAWPDGVRPGTQCDTPVVSVDFYPTLLELAGARPQPGQTLDGVSLVPLLRGRGPIARDAIYWHYPHYANQGGMPSGAVRHGDWKLIRFYDDDRNELYNLRDDPSERRDLARREPERAAALRAELDGWLKAVDANLCPPNPNYDPSKPIGASFEPVAQVKR